jgi:hypothetical protein
MSRQYAHHITVQCQGSDSAEGGPSPQRFVWRRRRYRVLAVVQRWVEVGSWWRGASAIDEEYDLWRVEAAAERQQGDTGQYDLCQHRGSGHWFLVRAFD